MKKTRRSWKLHLAGLLVLLLSSFSVMAEGISLFGSVSSEALTGLSGNDSGKGGFESDIRLVAETTAVSPVCFRAEAGTILSYGLSSEPAIAFDSAAVAPPAQLPPGDDLHREFYIDQAWTETTLERFSFKAGILPVAWGSAYIHNPVSRTAPPPIPGENLDRAIGRPGFLLYVPLPAGFSAAGYVLAAPRLAAPVPHIAELDVSTFPCGARIQFRSPVADIAIYGIREMMKEETSAYWLGADGTVVLGEATVYAEGAITSSFSTEIATGFSYTVPVIEVGLRGEYIFLSSGTDSDSYDGISFLEGSNHMPGRQYVFVQLEKEDPRAAAWKISVGTLVNLGDWSAAILAEAEWRPVSDFSIGGFSRIFSARESSSGEFGGSLPIAPGMALRPYRSVAGIRAIWHF